MKIQEIDKGDIFVRLLTSKKFRLLRHAIAVGLLFIAIVLPTSTAPEFAAPYERIGRIIIYIAIVGFFYANMYYLIPKYMFRGKSILYIVWLTVILLMGFFIVKTLFVTIIEPHRIIPKKEEAGLVVELTFVTVFLLLFILPSTALKVFQRWISDASRMSELQQKALESELAALKNQINPHFLFNMLNNVNVLITKDTQKASQIILKLSDFLRYQLYQSNDSSVFLSAEIRFLTDLLNMESIRRDNFTFRLDYDINELKGIKVPPNIFIIFIENAIKHSANPTGPSKVEISFTLNENRLIFKCTNGIYIDYKKSDTKGLGIANVTRRLELLYEKEFKLEISDLNTTYQVILNIPV